MTTTRSINASEAADLLTRTAENNATGGIGGPFALHGHPLPEALATLDHDGVTDLELCIRDGQITLIVRNPRFGDSHLYINPRPAAFDPWSVIK